MIHILAEFNRRAEEFRKNPPKAANPSLRAVKTASDKRRSSFMPANVYGCAALYLLKKGHASEFCEVFPHLDCVQALPDTPGQVQGDMSHGRKGVPSNQAIQKAKTRLLQLIVPPKGRLDKPRCVDIYFPEVDLKKVE